MLERTLFLSALALASAWDDKEQPKEKSGGDMQPEEAAAADILYEAIDGTRDPDEALAEVARMSGLPVALGLILFLLNREYMGAMFKEPCGWIMIGVGVVIIVSGFLIIQKIVRIEV